MKPKRSFTAEVKRARSGDLERLQRAYRAVEDMSRYTRELLEKLASQDKALQQREHVIRDLKQSLDEAETRAIRAAAFD